MDWIGRPPLLVSCWLKLARGKKHQEIGVWEGEMGVLCFVPSCWSQAVYIHPWSQILLDGLVVSESYFLLLPPNAASAKMLSSFVVSFTPAYIFLVNIPFIKLSLEWAI